MGGMFLTKPKFRHISPKKNLFIFLRFVWKIIRQQNYSSGKIFCREKLFVGRNYPSGKLFVGENFLSGKIICREKLSLGENYLSGKIICRGNFRHQPPILRKFDMLKKYKI